MSKRDRHGDKQNLDFFYGCASGQSRTALRKLNEPSVMINYATRDNQPWRGIGRLFIDSGGYSFMLGKGEYGTSPQQYVEYLREVSPNRYALRDYPCETEVLEQHDRSVAEHQRMTTEAHKELLSIIERRDVPGEWYPVVQGWEKEQYLEHLDDLESEGLIDDRLAIGTVCGREDVAEVREIVRAIASKVGEDVALHGFGVKRPAILDSDEMVGLLDSADSKAFVTRGMFAAREDERPFTWQECAYQYLSFKRRMQSITRDIGDADDSRLHDGQTTLPGVTA